MKRAIVCCVVLFYAVTAFSQRNHEINRYISIMPQYGRINVHSHYVSNLLGTYPMGIEVDVGKHYLTSAAKNLYGCYPRYGVAFSLWNFDNKVLGYGLSGMAYFEPFIFAYNRFMLSLKGSVGIIGLTNPYDAETNPNNLAYSTTFSFPLSVGIAAYYPLDYNWALKMNASFNHFSNGGIKQPNYGINFPVASMGVEYSFSHYGIPPREHSELLRLSPTLRVGHYEIAMGIGSKDVSGTGFHESKSISFVHGRFTRKWTKINGWTAGFFGEFENTFSSDFKSYIGISPVLGHSFWFGQFTFSQELGYTFVLDGSVSDKIIQLYALQYNNEYKWFAGVNLKANLNEANYLGVRVGYSFNLSNIFPLPKN